MHYTKEQKFLYSRVAVLLATVGWIVSGFAGLKGFSFWYGGFVLCFWVAFGLVNFHQKTSLWLAVRHRIPFLLLFGALAGFLIILDRAALNFHLWFYPTYHGLQFIWVYGVLYPFAALDLIELYYFTAKFLGEHLAFTQKPLSRAHRAIDSLEGLLFIAMTSGILAGALGWSISITAIAFLVLAWIVLYLAKLSFHLRHPKHFAYLLFLSAAVAAFFNEFPNTIAREWVYVYSALPFWNTELLSVPLWLWFGWLWFMLFTLRFWVTIVLHPKVK
ncbi:MAG TPA: hypothetical protein VJJ55_00310 [Candidatus Paceibacterota bacterium]